ncbi:MAG: bifunctional phosphoribosylaminoimidazolecarboxamide formyltransferase/IMP cyclohydrolase [Bacillota bacterium]|jgi:phosphoribosylaminoimidazolecarboxamide formyltransferase/IMP cyclohydrolase
MRRAIMSVADKTGLVDFAAQLVEMDWEIVSTGGTARSLKDGGVPVREVQDLTGFPEILGGRVKTLHPKIHGGILARRDKSSDMAELTSHHITPVDMVVCNLYPFVETARRPSATLQEIIEEIDIGGPTLLRASAKNWNWVITVCNPSRYNEIARQVRLTGDVDKLTRRQLAVEVFNHTAMYDAAIASHLGSLWKGWLLDFPEELAFGYKKVFALRYGENPHQKAAFYEPVMGSDVPSLAGRQIQGKELSYNNIHDADNAWRTVWDFPSPACVAVKHATPCGVAMGATAAEAFQRAFDADPVSIFGGVVAFNCPVDREAAEAMKKVFLEILMAPEFTEEALDILRGKKDLRVIPIAPLRPGGGNPAPARYSVRSAMGGLLVQEQDTLLPGEEEWQVVSKRSPTDQEIRDLRFAMTVCKHVKSNAIVLAKDGATVAIGGGQPNRVDCVRIAVERGREKVRGSVMASDAFFPFPDSVTEAVKAGVSAIVHPGGSIRDAESLAVADAHNVAMVVSGKRHFLH